MRLGIADFDAWLQTLRPSVIDGWMAFAQLEPEQFAVPPLATDGERSGNTKWMEADEAASKFAAKFNL